MTRLTQIRKHNLPGTGRITLTLPQGTEFLHWGAQGGILCVWTEEPKMPDYPGAIQETEDFKFIVRATGEEFINDPGIRYLASIELDIQGMQSGRIRQAAEVWHVYRDTWENI